MSRLNWDLWAVDPDKPGDPPDRLTVRKCVDIDTGKAIVFVVNGVRLENDGDEDGTFRTPAFDSFTIDDEDPTAEQEDEYSDELRDAVWDVLTET